MLDVNSKLAYLHGLAEGLGLDAQEGDPARLLRGILDVLDTMADDIEEVNSLARDLEDAVLDLRRYDLGRSLEDGVEVRCDGCGESVVVARDAFEDRDIVVHCPNCDAEISRAHARHEHRRHGGRGAEGHSTRYVD